MKYRRCFPSFCAAVAVFCVSSAVACVDGGASLTRAEAEQRAQQLWEQYAAAIREQRAAELNAMLVRAGEHDMKLLRKDFGEKPEGGRSLWISMHGGGGTAAEVNDQQWQNQIRLYEPTEGIYLAPRAPSNEWNLWHREEIDRLFDRLIESAILAWDVDPDRVYLLGYSAGGDGVYQLAPRMADRFAAAAMMAGHPNDASPLGLRNLPFAIFMGANDGAYNRNKVAAEWGEQLAALREADAEGYPHLVTIYEGLGHWMQGRDREALPWMARHTRSAWPRRVVWKQGNALHPRFYWLAVDEADAARGRTIIATVRDQTIELESAEINRVELLLHDALIDLDQPIVVKANNAVVFEGIVKRREDAMKRSLMLRADPRSIATARVHVSWEKAAQ
ncbi:MAG TPA: hypothetical protein PK098_07735 [Phycisphaerales bacterium]|nr:hypothetical protein [Phycisphaerales bacterium]